MQKTGTKETDTGPGKILCNQIHCIDAKKETKIELNPKFNFPLTGTEAMFQNLDFGLTKAKYWQTDNNKNILQNIPRIFGHISLFG